MDFAIAPSEGGWRLLAPSPLAARTNAATVWTGDEMIVWGGQSDEWVDSTDPLALFAFLVSIALGRTGWFRRALGSFPVW